MQSDLGYNCSMASLSDKLKSLGVRQGVNDLPKAGPSKQYGIDKIVAGTYRPTLSGETFVANQTFGMDYRHGQAAIQPHIPLGLLAAWAREPRFLELPLESYAFLDTETSGLAGGTGTYAFLVGVGRFMEGAFHLEQFFMSDPAEEASMLEALDEFLAPSQALVTFNGKAFDVPYISDRLAYYGMGALTGIPHFDVLHFSRRRWKDEFPSLRLSALEKEVLGIDRDDDIPGQMVPEFYETYLRSGNCGPLVPVVEHNRQDVVSLSRLFFHLLGDVNGHC